jgi:hypothetical protein
MTDHEPVPYVPKEIRSTGRIALVVLVALIAVRIIASAQAQLAGAHETGVPEASVLQGKAAVLTVSIAHPGTAPRTLLSGGLVLDLSGKQYLVVSYHAVAQPGAMRVDVVGGGSTLARMAWPLQETPRDLALLRLKDKASPAPLLLRDLAYRELTELKGAVMVGGAPGGHIARRPVGLSEARQYGKRYIFFRERFAHGASGAPIFARDEGAVVLRGVVAGNDGTFADGTKVKGGLAYTVAVIQELVSEFLRARSEPAGHPPQPSPLITSPLLYAPPDGR